MFNPLENLAKFLMHLCATCFVDCLGAVERYSVQMLTTLHSYPWSLDSNRQLKYFQVAFEHPKFGNALKILLTPLAKNYMQLHTFENGIFMFFKIMFHKIIGMHNFIFNYGLIKDWACLIKINILKHLLQQEKICQL